MADDHRGFFVVVEGADGSGKTTLARRLARAYRRRGWQVCLVREPGGTRLSERVRRVLLDPLVKIGPRSELFLYLAARSEVVDEVIRPALARGEMVIADRFFLSTYAYQSAGRGLPLTQVAQADRLAREGLVPDLTIVLTVTQREAARRQGQMARRADRIEKSPAKFHRAVRAFYDAWGRGSARNAAIDSRAGADAVFARALSIVDGHLRRCQ